MAAKRISTTEEIAAARAAVQAIDWAAPWMRPWAAHGLPVARLQADGMTQPQALNTVNAQCGHPAPVRFIAQAQLPPGTAYEQHIFDTACVPTREGLHDLFNALTWMRFAQAKRQLNRLHAAQLAHSGVAATRGPVRDACTLLDENALLLQCDDALWQALARRQWLQAFITLRPLWAAARSVTFGHALVEKLAQPYKAITAHVWRVAALPELAPAVAPDAAWDAWLARDLQADKLATKPFIPLPVLGIPGWWPANEEAGFYDDGQVFRPPRLKPRVLT